MPLLPTVFRAFKSPSRCLSFSSRSDRKLSQAQARGEQTRLYYLGFIGESRVLKKEANEPMTSACLGSNPFAG